MAQTIKITGDFVAAGNRQHLGADDFSKVVYGEAGIAAIRVQPASRSPRPRCFSAGASSSTLPSKVSRPPWKAAVTFFRQPVGSENGNRQSSAIVGVVVPLCQ